MRLRLRHFALLAFTCLLTFTAFSQATTISGTVTNKSTGEGIPAVSVLLKGTSAGVFTDDKGNFKLTTNQKPPFILVFSSVGYTDQEVNVSSAGEAISVGLVPSYNLGEEIVVSASRVAERRLDAPVTVERVGSATIRNAPAASYYDVLANIKGVDMTTSSINFKTPSTRGFNGSGNLRFNQLVDGMDNQAPALNFSVGSVVGLTELDVDNMELLVGASSALYGSGGMNGTLLINSKNPFKYQGLSFQIKQGVNHVDNAQRRPAPYYDWSFRWGKKISERFAFKIGGQLIQSQDWQANDQTNLLRNNVLSNVIGGTRASDPNYDGVNVYGDEVSANMQYLARLGLSSAGITPSHPAYVGFNTVASMGLTYAQSVALIQSTPSLAGLVPYINSLFPTVFSINRGYYSQNISRTGYNETDLVDYGAYNVKFTGGLYYKLNNNIEASLVGNWGLGTSVYTGLDRYSLKNFKLGQYKAELKARNWFVRAYTTQENSGDSYAATITAVQIDRKWKSDNNWFSNYISTYTQFMLGGASQTLAHANARAAADNGRYLPGSESFKQAFASVTGTSITNGGGLFADKSALYHFEGQYDFSEQFKVVDLLVGASYRIYSLNSGGTIFADHDPKFGTSTININESGAYLQVAKKFLKDVLKLTGSIRYDKNQNFDGRFTPRVTALVKVAKDNNIRLSYQSAYRFPSTQDQWINLNSPSATLVGALPIFDKVYNFSGNPIYTAESVAAYRASYTQTGVPNNALLVPAKFNAVKPESVNSYEIGYRGIIAEKLLVDAYYYFSSYKDFLGRVAVARGQNGTQAELLSPTSTNNYSFVTNSASSVKANGWGISAEYKLPRNFALNANVSGDKINNAPVGVVTNFNTPKLRFNVGLNNSKVFDNWGFGIVYKWQDKINWEGTFGTGEIPAYGTLDGMISYKAGTKSLIKLGATNLFNHYYRSAFGNPMVGGLYYISFGYNVF